MSIFGTRLYRTPYLVLPRIALEAMPEEWQKRLEALLQEAKDTGLVTPAYLVFRDMTLEKDDHAIFGVNHVNHGKWDEKPFYRFTTGWKPDPWSEYRHATIEDVRALCPTFLTKETTDEH